MNIWYRIELLRASDRGAVTTSNWQSFHRDDVALIDAYEALDAAARAALTAKELDQHEAMPDDPHPDGVSVWTPKGLAFDTLEMTLRANDGIEDETEADDGEYVRVGWRDCLTGAMYTDNDQTWNAPLDHKCRTCQPVFVKREAP